MGALTIGVWCSWKSLGVYVIPQRQRAGGGTERVILVETEATRRHTRSGN